MRLAAISLVLLLLLLKEEATAAIFERSGQKHGTPTAKVRQSHRQSPTYVRSSAQLYPGGFGVIAASANTLTRFCCACGGMLRPSHII